MRAALARDSLRLWYGSMNRPNVTRLEGGLQWTGRFLADVRFQCGSFDQIVMWKSNESIVTKFQGNNQSWRIILKEGNQVPEIRFVVKTDECTKFFARVKTCQNRSDPSSKLTVRSEFSDMNQ